MAACSLQHLSFPQVEQYGKPHPLRLLTFLRVGETKHLLCMHVGKEQDSWVWLCNKSVKRSEEIRALANGLFRGFRGIPVEREYKSRGIEALQHYPSSFILVTFIHSILSSLQRKCFLSATRSTKNQLRNTKEYNNNITRTRSTQQLHQP